jgi:hypothetical protein
MVAGIIRTEVRCQHVRKMMNKRCATAEQRLNRCTVARLATEVNNE